MERKYRQKGYQDDRNDRKEQPKERTKVESGYGSRPSPRIETRFVDVIRCANCSAVVETVGNVAFTDQCKKCNADLHSCKNCRYFDPGARFECQRTIEARIAKKAERNICLQFATKVSVEKQQQSQEAPTKKTPQQQQQQKEPVNSARQAFDNLFKKS